MTGTPTIGCDLRARLRATGLTVSLMAALLAGGRAVQASDLMAFSSIDLTGLWLLHQPIDPEAEGRVEIELDAEGQWTDVKTDTVSWNIAGAGGWKQPPASYHASGLQIVAHGVPLSESGSCNGSLCQSDGYTGFYHPFPMNSMLLSAGLNHTFDAPLEEFDISQGIWNNVEGACFKKRQEMLASGSSLNSILKLGFVVEGPWTSAIVHAFFKSGVDGEDRSLARGTYLPLKVHCKGNPALADTLAPLPSISVQELPPVTQIDAQLTVLEQTAPNGLCQITLSGLIVADVGNAQISFRYEDGEGEESQVHEVTTDPLTKAINFAHDYAVPYEPDGTTSGEVRIKGVSHDFETDWKPYAIACHPPAPGGLVSKILPDLNLALVESKKEMIEGEICTTEVKLVGVVMGKGPFSGFAHFNFSHGGSNNPNDRRTVEIAGQENVILGKAVNIHWPVDMGPFEAGAPGAEPPAMSQAGSFWLTLLDANGEAFYNSKGHPIAQTHVPYVLTCSKPKAMPGIVVGAPQITSDKDSDPQAPLVEQPEAETARTGKRSLRDRIKARVAERKVAAEQRGERKVRRGAEGAKAKGARAQIAAVALPDLAIERAQPATRDKTVLRVRVVNRGKGAADSSVLEGRFLGRIGQSLAGEAAVGAIGPGEGRWVEIGFPRKVAIAKSIELTVDSGNAVEEADERNNRFGYRTR